MKRHIILSLIITAFGLISKAQSGQTDSSSVLFLDTTITIHETDIYTWRNKDDEMEFNKDVQRIRIMLPYLKMARHMYAQVEEEENQWQQKILSSLSPRHRKGNAR